MSEFKNKNAQELTKTLYDKRVALKNFRFGIAGSKVRNVKEGRELKRDIARIMTELSALAVTATPAPKTKTAPKLSKISKAKK
ncbi:50S ribosomal protein L29 [Candidatus Parcubacteria bacterium]|nr:50S ribosomal protein L29 [Candidatus Parcubacteria bacterium]